MLYISDRGKTRTLHRNLLLLVNDLPVEVPTTTPGSTKPERQKKTVRHTSNDSMDDRDSDLVSSDAESSAGGYWLRAPVNRLTSGSDRPQEQAPVRENIRVMQGRESSGQIEDREVQRTSQSPTDRRTTTYLEAVNPVEEGDRANTESEHDYVDRAEALEMEEETSVRKSARERRPRQIHIYDMLGQSAIHPYTPTLNSVTVYSILPMPVWGLQNYTTPITYPHWYLPSVHTSYGVTTGVY